MVPKMKQTIQIVLQPFIFIIFRKESRKLFTTKVELFSTPKIYYTIINLVFARIIHLYVCIWSDKILCASDNGLIIGMMLIDL